MTFRAAGLAPPIVLLLVRMSIPSLTLPSAAVPAAFRPMRLPAINVPVAVGPSTQTPLEALPEITLPAPLTVPPMVLDGAFRPLCRSGAILYDPAARRKER